MYEASRTGKLRETERRMVVTVGWGRGSWELLFREDVDSVL